MDSGILEPAPNGAVHLDTVRSLHQTVVSLRTALEVSKNELKELKEKYEKHSKCNEFVDVIEKLTLENHILRRKIIDSGHEDNDIDTQDIKLELTYSPITRTKNKDSEKEVFIKTDVNKTLHTSDLVSVIDINEGAEFCSTDKLNEILETHVQSAESKSSTNVTSPTVAEEEESQTSQVTNFHHNSEEPHQPAFRTKLELLSKFDVRIKVQTLKEGSVASSSTSDSDSTTADKNVDSDTSQHKPNFEFLEKKAHFENFADLKGNKVNLKAETTENIKMAVPSEAEAKSKVDKFDVQVRITSEENFIVKENFERSRRKDTLNLDVDDLSLRSMSEGDNSVFSEGVTTPIDPTVGAGADEKLDQENASGNESEEVDDIELIFTTDESKDMSNLQEDLVSIRESDQWCPSSISTRSTHSTPVLIKFHTLDPDFQPGGEIKDNAENENQVKTNLQGVITESSLRTKRVSLPSDKDIRHVAFNGKGSLDLPGRGILKSYENKSDNMLYKKSPNTSSRRLDSVDSLTCEYNRGLSFDNTKSSSFELGSSMDILHREESVDSFQRPHHLGHRFSVFAETDISKCGTSEDDLAMSLNVRRNTCPNPFQYRPSGYRGSNRTSGPLKAGGGIGSRHIRPVLREGSAPRRSSAAQTDMCALPNRWSSDGYLAHKMWLSPPTVPQRAGTGAGMGTGAGRRLVVPNARPAPLPPDHPARVPLSDIGFTSMVPELSRSADPVWALGKRMHGESPVSTSTSKFLSRGSSYRSPCLSIDRSTDWTPHLGYTHISRGFSDSRAWRSSLPDVRYDDTDELVHEAEVFLRRSIDNFRYNSLDLGISCTCGCSRVESQFCSGCASGGSGGGGGVVGKPYIPREPRHLRLGHAVKVIAPSGRLHVGRVRYVGLAGGTAATSSVVVGGEFPLAIGGSLPRNDGVYRGRRYFLTQPNYTALFVPFSKVVMAWAN